MATGFNRMLRVEGTGLDRLFWEHPFDEPIAAIITIIAVLQGFLPYLFGFNHNGFWYDPQEAFPYFSAKRIRIFAHQDQPGQAAADRWTEQLKDTARVDRFSFQGLVQANGEPVKDLNDLLKISNESYRSSAKVIDSVMRF